MDASDFTGARRASLRRASLLLASRAEANPADDATDPWSKVRAQLRRKKSKVNFGAAPSPDEPTRRRSAAGSGRRRSSVRRTSFAPIVAMPPEAEDDDPLLQLNTSWALQLTKMMGLRATTDTTLPSSTQQQHAPAPPGRRMSATALTAMRLRERLTSSMIRRVSRRRRAAMDARAAPAAKWVRAAAAAGRRRSQVVRLPAPQPTERAPHRRASALGRLESHERLPGRDFLASPPLAADGDGAPGGAVSDADAAITSASSAAATAKRAAARAHPLVVDALDLFWEAAVRTARSQPGRAAAPEELQRRDYLTLWRLLYRALVDLWDESEAQACAEEDWRVDVQGEAALKRQRFHHALFELADLFTPSVDPKEHARFLQRLFHCVAEGCPEPLYLWRNEVDVEYGGYALPTEADEVAAARRAEATGAAAAAEAIAEEVQRLAEERAATAAAAAMYAEAAAERAEEDFAEMATEVRGRRGAVKAAVEAAAPVRAVLVLPAAEREVLEAAVTEAEAEADAEAAAEERAAEERAVEANARAKLLAAGFGDGAGDGAGDGGGGVGIIGGGDDADDGGGGRRGTTAGAAALKAIMGKVRDGHALSAAELSLLRRAAGGSRSGGGVEEAIMQVSIGEQRRRLDAALAGAGALALPAAGGAIGGGGGGWDGVGGGGVSGGGGPAAPWRLLLHAMVHDGGPAAGGWDQIVDVAQSVPQSNPHRRMEFDGLECEAWEVAQLRRRLAGGAAIGLSRMLRPSPRDPISPRRRRAEEARAPSGVVRAGGRLAPLAAAGGGGEGPALPSLGVGGVISPRCGKAPTKSPRRPPPTASHAATWSVVASAADAPPPTFVASFCVRVPRPGSPPRFEGEGR